MSKEFLTDYYPVYKDVMDQFNLMSLDQSLEYPFGELDHSSDKPGSGSETLESPVMLNAEELTDLAMKCGFTVFQTAILLVKNAFEGHSFLNFQIRSEELSHKGTILLQTKPELLLPSFYKHFSRDLSGQSQIEKVLKGRHHDLTDINFESVIHCILVNPILRLPVSVFASVDIRKLAGLAVLNHQAILQRTDLFLLGERVLGEYEVVDSINVLYAEKFKECRQQFRLKEEVFSHYQRKLAMAFYPNIHTEEELDELMYKKLLEEKMHYLNDSRTKMHLENLENSHDLFAAQKLKEKTRVLYRLVSKNCAEVHTGCEAENTFPVLNQIFMDVNSIYNEPVSDLSDIFLQYQRMILLLSKAIIYRKTHDLKLSESIHLLSDIAGKEVLVSKEEFRVLRRNLDDTLVALRINSFTDYKLKFVTDDEFEEIHNHFLKKQIEFIDEQILRIQSDIQEILSQKSQSSILKSSNN